MNNYSKIKELAEDKRIQRKIRVTVYVKRGSWEMFKQRCEAENLTPSHVIEAFMEEFAGKKD